MGASPRSPSLAQESSSALPRAASEKRTNRTEVSVLRNQKSPWDATRSTPGASPPRLGGRTRRDEYGTCAGKGQTKSDQGRKASEESLSISPSRAGRDAAVDRSHGCGCHFFFSHRWELTVLEPLL